jgi:ribosomal protein L12E/L44/L45/RPP1/RPP2
MDGAFSQAGVASTAYAASFVLSALGKVTLPKVVKPPRAPRKPAAAAAAAAVPGQVADLPQR